MTRSREKNEKGAASIACLLGLTKYGNRSGTQGVFVDVFVNGGYNGLYCMIDKSDRKQLGLRVEELAVTLLSPTASAAGWTTMPGSSPPPAHGQGSGSGGTATPSR